MSSRSDPARNGGPPAGLAPRSARADRSAPATRRPPLRRHRPGARQDQRRRGHPDLRRRSLPLDCLRSLRLRRRRLRRHRPGRRDRVPRRDRKREIRQAAVARHRARPAAGRNPGGGARRRGRRRKVGPGRGALRHGTHRDRPAGAGVPRPRRRPRQGSGCRRTAAAAGARLVVFPETFVPGYPAWIWRLRPGSDMALDRSSFMPARSPNRSTCNRDDLAPLREAAARHEVNRRLRRAGARRWNSAAARSTTPSSSSAPTARSRTATAR